MDRKTEEEEKAKLILKFFDYAETPIQEWLAEYLGVDVNELFEDYQDNSDIIGFKNENNGKHYEAYLVTMSSDAGLFVDKQLLDSSEKTRKSCSMLFDAVHQVFPAVVSTINKDYADRVKFLHPKFDNDGMRFCLHRTNGAALELKLGLDARKQIIQCLNNEKQLDPNTLENVHKRLEDVNKMIQKNNVDVLNAEEKLCRELNEVLPLGTWLYLAVDEGQSEVSEESLQRLPVFGLRYQDPDEENYIDKLKKEYSVNE
jgi:hypothetical protein